MRQKEGLLMIGKVTIPVLVMGLVLLTGCAAGGTDGPGDEPTQAPEPSTLPPALRGEGTDRDQHATQRAKEDLARHLDVDVKGIDVISLEAVDWPDASLGCPEPGKLYAQVITAGYRIVLQAAGQQYPYHTDSEAKQVVHCSDDQKRLETMRQKSSPEQAIVAARQDLAVRLGVALDDVVVARVTEEMFPAGDLGCPCPGCPQSSMTGLVGGQRIILTTGGKEYEYRARGMAERFCGER
jgi:hypothetical protein